MLRAYNPCHQLMFRIYQSTVPEIDEVLVAMTDADAGRRLGAKEALDRLGTVVRSMPMESLLIEPLVLHRD